MNKALSITTLCLSLPLGCVPDPPQSEDATGEGDSSTTRAANDTEASAGMEASADASDATDSSGSTGSGSAAGSDTTTGASDSTDTASSTGEDESTGSGEPPVECGDGVVGGDEECDEGPDNDDNGHCKADCTLQACGDGFLGPDEACDDGNEVDDDHCSNDCVPATCGDGVINGDEECDDGPDNEDTGGCKTDCTLQVCGDGFVGPREGCDDANPIDDDDCSNACIPATCGDGVINGDDECDDANADDGDDCPTTCQAAYCGDGFVWDGVEGCDDANTSDDDACLSTCEPASCGDGFIWSGEEECDDTGESALCNANCTDSECGDGIINIAAGEQCDDAGESALCDADCTPPLCGDGIVNVTAGEQCDDAGESALCDADCTAAQCGDGIVNIAAGEQCDDGNMIDDDSCTNDCQINCSFNVALLPLPLPVDGTGEIDFDGGCNLIVAGGANEDTVERIDAAGGISMLSEIPLVVSTLGIAYRPSDDLIYVSTDIPSQLWSVTSTGVSTPIMGLPSTFNAIEVAPAGFGAYGDMIVAASHDGIVYAVDPVAASVSIVGDAGGIISDLVFDPLESTLYLADYYGDQILTMDATGLVGTFAVDLGGPDGLAIDPATTLFVASSLPMFSGVTALDIATGTGSVIAEPTFSVGHYATGLRLDGSGNLLMKLMGGDIDYIVP